MRHFLLFWLIFKFRSYSARSDLKNRSARFSGYHPFQDHYMHESTVGTEIIADPEKCFQELISEKLLRLLRERPRLELIIVSSNFQALLFWQDKLLESV